MTDDDKPDAPTSRPKVLGREERVLPKRFYKEVGLGATLGGFAILLDGRPVKTPTKNQLVLPREGLANAIAEEWATQGPHIEPHTMPLTKLANTAIDRVRSREDDIIDELTAFAGSDLVCYRADRPQSLVQAQAAAWDPVLAWSRSALEATFVPVVGLMHKPQPAQSVARVRVALAAHDPFALCALHNMTSLTGSILLVLAHAHGAFDVDTIWTAAHIDEDHQIAAWGTDAEAEVRRAGRWKDMQAAARMLALARG